jgi:hypothetical protein
VIIRLIVIFIACICESTVWGATTQFSTELSWETRIYLDESQYGVDEQFENVLKLRPNFSYAWDNYRKLIQLTPYAAYSTVDDNRTHADLREASFTGSYGNFEIKAGLSRVFWGVAESVHLVDIINQTDLVENIDGEEKLGQPMLSTSWISTYGQLSLFLLPYFRERNFPGMDGRLRSSIVVDDDHPVFESSREEKHIDWAVRWSKSISVFDIGISHFRGTSRDPVLAFSVNSIGNPVLLPTYYLIDQTGVDIQVTFDSLLLKHESIYRNYQSYTGDFFAQVSGLEYTILSAFDSNYDIGLITEYIYADDEQNSLISSDNNLFFGVRCTFNDIQGTEFLAGINSELDTSNHTISVEGKRRITDKIALSLEARLFNFNSGQMESFDKESYVQIELSYVQ